MPDWRFLEKHCPGIRAAWDAQVRLDGADFMIGTTGSEKRKTFHAVARSIDWYATSERRHFKFDPETRTWTETDLTGR